MVSTRRRLGLSAAALGTLGCGGAGANANTVPAAAPSVAASPRPVATATPAMEARRVVFQLPGMEAATVRRDVQYKMIDGRPLELDVYSPPGSAQKRSAVLFVHGYPVPPGTKFKNTGQYVSWGQLAAASGLVGIPFDWRGDPADLGDALAYVRRSADDLGIDAARLALFGVSAGGGPTMVEALRDIPPAVHAVVSYYSNLTAAVSALGSRTAAPLPAVLVVKAGRDTTMPAAAADQFVADAKAKGADVEALVHPTGVHAFDLLNDDDTSRDIIKQTLAFLTTRLSVR